MLDPQLMGPGAPTPQLKEKSTNPARRGGYQKPVLSMEVANTGGSCQYCGTPLQFWFNYRTCNKCLEIGSNAVIQA